MISAGSLRRPWDTGASIAHAAAVRPTCAAMHAAHMLIWQRKRPGHRRALLMPAAIPSWALYGVRPSLPPDTDCPDKQIHHTAGKYGPHGPGYV